MEFETYTQQAYQYLYKPCLSTLSQHQLPPSNSLYTSTEYVLIEVICDSSSQTSLSSSNLSFVFNALGSLGLTIAYLIQVTPNKIKTYFALQHSHSTPLGVDILFQSLEALDASIKLNLLQNSQSLIDELLFTHEKTHTISAASLIPNPNTSNTLLTDLIKLIPKDTYTLMLLAEPIPHSCYLQVNNYLNKLYFNLSRFREITFSNNKSTTYTDCNTSSKTCTQNETCSSSQTDTQSDTNNSSKTRSTSISLANRISEKVSLTSNSNDSCNNTDNLTNTNSASNSSSNQNTDSDSRNHSKTCTTVESSGTNSRAIQSEIIHLLEQLDRIFVRLRTTQSLTMFNFCTYFFSPSPTTCIRTAFNYAGLAYTDIFPLSNQYVNTWLPQSPYFEAAFNYLHCFHHPVFFTQNHCDYISPTFPISSPEYASLIQFCFS